MKKAAITTRLGRLAGVLIGSLWMASCGGGANDNASASPRPRTAAALATPAAPYITAQDGHFYRNGQRVRLWGVNLQAAFLRNHEEIDNMVKRLQTFGFNGVRLWTLSTTFYGVDASDKRIFLSADKDHPSELERFDYLVHKLAEAGIAMHMTMLHNVGMSTVEKESNPEVQAWAAAANDPKASASKLKIFTYAPYVSPAWRSMMMAYQARMLDRVNVHSGRRYADEPAVSTWELANESQFVQCSLDATCFNGLPAIARQSLSDRWVASNQWNPEHRPLKDLNVNDVLQTNYVNFARFVYETFYNASQEMRVAARSKGAGVAVQPFLFNTGPGQPHAIAHMAYSRGDAASMDGYTSPMAGTVDGGYDASPWQPITMGGKLPQMLQAFRVANKPFIVYETSFYRPYRYRAEWGPVLAAQGLKQDWDAVYLYSVGVPNIIYDKLGADADYGARRLPDFAADPDNCSKNYADGFQHAGDPVVMSSWALGGRLFRSVSESPKPQVKWVLTGESVFGSDNAKNGHGYPAPFLSRTDDARDATVTVDFQWISSSPCVPCDYRGDRARLPGSFEVTWDRSSLQGKLKIRTAAGGVAYAGHLEGDLGELLPGMNAVIQDRGFGIIGALEGNVAGNDTTVKTLFMTGTAENKGYGFDKSKVVIDSSKPYGAHCGVTDTGDLPLVFGGPSAAVTTSSPRAFVPYRFDMTHPPATPPAAQFTLDSGSGSVWVTAKP